MFWFVISRRPLGESSLRIGKMYRNLDRYAKHKYPSRPKTTEDVIKAFENPENRVKYGKNLRGNDDFYIDSVLIEPDSSFTVFASHQIIDMIKKYIPVGQRNYLMDGTFKVAPIGYYQLLGIYIQWKNSVCFNTKN